MLYWPIIITVLKKTMVPPLLSIQGPTRQVQGLQGHLQDVQEQLQDHLEAPQRPSEAPQRPSEAPQKPFSGPSVTFRNVCFVQSAATRRVGACLNKSSKKKQSKDFKNSFEYINQKSLCRPRAVRGTRDSSEAGPFLTSKFPFFEFKIG